MDDIVKIENLVKKYGDLTAVNNISFSIERGSFFAFLGPNGAGKSTTINIMTTLLEPNNGNVYLNNKTDKNYFRQKIGVVFQENILDGDLTVKENLMYRGTLYLNKHSLVKQRYKELREFLKLDEFENQRFKTLSGGQKRRTEIARALFSNPEILLLDEPTTGLDPETRQNVWKVIDDLRKKDGLTIFLTTHYMEEAANADNVIIINKGSIVAQGTPWELKEQYSSDHLKIVPINKEEFMEALLSIDKDYVTKSDQFIFNVYNTKETLDLIDRFKPLIKQFEVIKGTMDDVFITVIGGDK